MKIKLAYILFFSLILNSCTVQNVEFRGVKSVTPKQFTKDKAVLAVIAVLDNPNSFGFKITGSEINLFSENVKIGEAKISKFRVLKNSEQAYDLTLVCDLLPEFHKQFNFMSILSGKKLKLKADGWVKGRKFIISKKVAIKFEKELNVTEFLGK